MSHPDLQAEQAYLDHAHGCLEAMRERLGRASDAADGEIAAAALEAWSARRVAKLDDARRGFLFGCL